MCVRVSHYVCMLVCARTYVLLYHVHTEIHSSTCVTKHVCIYECLNACVYMCHQCMRVYAFVYAYDYTYMCLSAHVCVFGQVCEMYAFMRVDICACLMCLCTHVFVDLHEC